MPITANVVAVVAIVAGLAGVWLTDWNQRAAGTAARPPGPRAAASVSDKAGLKLLVIRLVSAVSTLKIMWADGGYDGTPIARWVKTAAASLR